MTMAIKAAPLVSWRRTTLGGVWALAAFIALANVYTRTNIAFGVEAQGFAAACGLKPLAEPSQNAALAS